MRIPSSLILAILALSGCNTAQQFEDVSSSTEYATYVGVEYALKVEMHLSGVNGPPGYEESIDYYVVNPAVPGWSGPELITRETLPVGTAIRVESVHRCTNCLFEKPLKAKIVLTGYKSPIDLPVHIPLKYLNDEFVRRL